MKNIGEQEFGVWSLELHLRAKEARSLELPFSEEEVFPALSALNGDKTLGPNVFTIDPWQLC